MPSLTAEGRRAASLIVLTLQNTTLALLLHYSRIRGSHYSAATAVLFNEILKGSISLGVAYKNCKPDPEPVTSIPLTAQTLNAVAARARRPSEDPELEDLFRRLSRLKTQVFSRDCWKLSIPAILYVIQNNLQFVAASNLDVATFQVSYQLKILTTAVFSVLMLHKKLTRLKWAALFFLALGVGIVQVQAAGSGSGSSADRDMNPTEGFVAVFAACITSGLAGVYFEMVLKGSTADLWVRNVQLSLFSLVPALLPALKPVLLEGEGVAGMLRGFGVWAWAVVWCQVIGGLVTALVIKYSDNIVKGFATSLSIIISFAASSMLFPDEFSINLAFLLGTATVLAATYLYNRPSSLALDGTPRIDDLSLQDATVREPLLPTTGASRSRQSSPRSSPRSSMIAIGLNKFEAIQGGPKPRPESPQVAVADLLPDGRKRHAAVSSLIAEERGIS